ncbi:hypothetical protein SLEP1_g22081 [Rubroshorea leprosula]|uniref:Uncharacterized protein n=1 Tax=Rubroshorea leprosula TaxID=152421 RepID=A0AAV5JHD4_9ROSI|nr:hypothetical protein SLEP1_g22081 [Rubroshorea leprosula]
MHHLTASITSDPSWIKQFPVHQGFLHIVHFIPTYTRMYAQNQNKHIKSTFQRGLRD